MHHWEPEEPRAGLLCAGLGLDLGFGEGCAAAGWDTGEDEGTW